jgi:hypothetical protein
MRRFLVGLFLIGLLAVAVTGCGPAYGYGPRFGYAPYWDGFAHGDFGAHPWFRDHRPWEDHWHGHPVAFYHAPNDRLANAGHFGGFHAGAFHDGHP